MQSMCECPSSTSASLAKILMGILKELNRRRFSTVPGEGNFI